MLHIPHYCVKINQKILFKGIGVGGVTLPHELRLISFNSWEIFIFFQIYIFTMLITNVFCLQIVNKKAKLYKLLQMKISFFHKFWNCARVAAFDMPPLLEIP